MKREAVSVLKPRNGKSISKIGNNAVTKMAIADKNFDETRVSRNKKLKIKLEQPIATVKKEKIIVKPKFNEKSTTVNDKIATKSTMKEKSKVMKRKTNENVANYGLTKMRVINKIKIKSDELITTSKKHKIIVKTESTEKSMPVEATVASNLTTKQKKSKVMKKKNIENVGDLKLTKIRVLKSIRSIQQLSQKQQESKKSLLPTDNNPLLLQVTCIRIAKTPRRNIRPYLPHPLVGPLDDVALFVPDLERGRGRDYEKTVDHWETILREKGVDCIKEVIPMNRVKTEYRQFEMQRKLAMSFDYFLVDGKIVGHMTHLLGKAFFKRRNAPTPVKLGRDNLKKEFNFALHKTCMEIHSYGNSHTMTVGTIFMEPKNLAENVWAACEEIAKEYPGGWDNIRSIRLKTNTGPAVPIYMSLASKNDVPIPVVKPKRPRAYETVSGELTTVPGGANVQLTPEGRIYVTKLKDYGDDDKDEAHDEDDDEDEEEEEDELKQESESEKGQSDAEEDND